MFVKHGYNIKTVWQLQRSKCNSHPSVAQTSHDPIPSRRSKVPVLLTQCLKGSSLPVFLAVPCEILTGQEWERNNNYVTAWKQAVDKLTKWTTWALPLSVITSQRQKSIRTNHKRTNVGARESRRKIRLMNTVCHCHLMPRSWIQTLTWHHHCQTQRCWLLPDCNTSVSQLNHCCSFLLDAQSRNVLFHVLIGIIHHACYYRENNVNEI